MAGLPSGTNKLLAGLARQHGPRLIDQAVVRLFPHAPPRAGEEPVEPPPPTILHRVASFVLLRVATKSVPGAILVGGGLLAKSLYDRHQQTNARKSATIAAAAGVTLPPRVVKGKARDKASGPHG